MDKAVVILFESSFSLILFYFVYQIWLKKETFFKVNRFYLLLSVVASLIIPWLNFSFKSDYSNDVVLYNVLEVVTINASGYQESFIQMITTFQWIGILYTAGLLLMLALFLLKLLKITRIDKRSHLDYNGELPKNVKLIKADVVPFSFLKRIYINPKNYNSKQLKEIIMHEQVHINQQHTYDCLFYELLIVFFWFNPIVYKYRTSARELHEFLADEGAIRSGILGVEYQQLLFEQAIGLETVALANSFNYSLIKRRLIMLTKIRSSKIAKIRLLYVLPILGTLIIAFACNDEKGSVEKTDIKKSSFLDGNKESNTMVEKTENETMEIKEIPDDPDANRKNGDIYFTVDKMPEFSEGEQELRMFIANNVKYPKEAANKEITGRVYVSFVVNKAGQVENVQLAKGVDPLLDKEAIRVVSAMPAWIPGEHNGKKVKVGFTIPINFQLN